MNNQQLALAIQLNYQANLNTFCWDEENRLIKQQIEAMLKGHGDHFLYIWGATGCGKSHLLQACCQLHPQAVYLPLDILKEWGPASIEGMAAHDLLALDNIDAIAGDSAWEEALFHLYNQVRDRPEATLLISGQHPPASSAIQLPDLRSRLAWGLVLQLKELNDELKITALQQQADKRGFHLNSSVALFLINRCGRNMHELQGILDRLDEASLAAQRRITVPFVKKILGV